MATDAKSTMTTEVPSNTPPADPNVHLHQFLTDNNYVLTVDALTEHNPFLVGKGFVLTDKPLLVVSVKKKGGSE